MSALPQGVWQNQEKPLYYPLSFSTVSVKNIRGWDAVFSSITTAGSFNADTISASMAYLSSISTTSITLDGNTLDTGGGGFGATLLLNGVPIATTSNISSVADWAYFPAISTIDCDQKDIVDCKDIFATNLTASNSIAGVIGGFTTLNSGSIVNSGSVLTNTLQTTGLLQAASISTPSLKANLISTGTVNASTLVGANAAIGGVSTNTLSTATILTGSIGANSGVYSTINVSTITAGSVIFPVDNPNLVVSSITVNGNTTTQTVTVTNGGNFSGTRPNFLTGINTSGANNFNNTNLDNCGQINAGALNLFGSATIGLTADSGGSILTNTAINLATSNGGSSVINIEAKRNALAAYPVPLSQVNIVAEGNCPNIPIVPLTPYGGAVNITANAGQSPIFPLVAVTDAFAPGAIHLTAYSKLLFPGLITEAAGSILAYSGLTNPTAGLYGCSFYSALTCLSLTAGLSPALTSFPGTVYLRGDNGTKVLNGLYIDHLYPAAGYTLAISGAGGSNVTIDDCAYIGMTTNPVLDGGNVNGQIRNFSTISALKVLTPTLNVSTISTGTVLVDQIYTRNINIDPPSTIYTVHPDLTINANITTDEADDPQYNNLNLYASSNINIQSFTTGGGGGNINIQCGNNPAFYSINITGDTYVSRTLTANLGMSTTNINLSTINGAAYVPGGGGGSVSSFTDLFATNASTTNLFVSSINGAAYPPSGGGGSTISTFTTLTTSSFTVSSIGGATLTSNLTMGLNDIIFTGGKSLSCESNQIYMSGNGTDYVTMYNGSAAIQIANDQNIYFSANGVAVGGANVANFQNTSIFMNNGNINVNNNNITSVSSITSVVVSTININLSTINGAAYPPSGGGSSWVSTATTALNMAGFNINNAGLISSLNVYAGTAVVGEPSAFGSVCAYFGNSSRATNGSEYAILQENNGRTFLNAVAGTDISFRINNTDAMIMDASALNMLSNDINNVKNIDFLSGNIATGSNFLDINGGGLGTFTSMKSGDTYYTIDTAGNPTVNALSTNQVAISQTAGSDFILFNNGDTRMNAKRDAYVEAVANIQTASISTINTVQNTYFSGGVSRRLDGVGVVQPIIQYGQVSSSGSAGTVIVSTPQAYSAINTYLPFACMADAPAAELYVSTLTEQAFEIGWQNGGGGAQLFNWNTMGT